MTTLCLNQDNSGLFSRNINDLFMEVSPSVPIAHVLRSLPYNHSKEPVLLKTVALGPKGIVLCWRLVNWVVMGRHVCYFWNVTQHPNEFTTSVAAGHVFIWSVYSAMEKEQDTFSRRI